jgi:alkylation response protein AidB-like acyl-CoA dehydrogenase
MSLVPDHITLSEDERALIRAVGKFARNELLPLDRAWDRGEGCVDDILPKLAAMGLMNLVVPTSEGGLGCAYHTYAAIIHELAVSSPATAVTIGVHTQVGDILERFAGESIHSEVLTHWGSADNFAAFCLSEAGAGSDASSARTTAVEVDGGFRITGEKMWVTNGLSARWFLTICKLDDAANKDRFCALLVERDSDGLAIDEIHGKMGIRGSKTAVVNFDNVFVATDRLIGGKDQGLEVALSSLGKSRVGIAAQASGISQACLTEMVSYAREREQFGQTIGKFQAVSNMIADSGVELEASKSLIWRAAVGIDRGEFDRRATSMAKLYASEAANRIAYRAVQVHGGTGYVQECRVEQLYRDARITSIYEGTSEVQRIVIARELAKN